MECNVMESDAVEFGTVHLDAVKVKVDVMLEPVVVEAIWEHWIVRLAWWTTSLWGAPLLVNIGGESFGGCLITT